MKSIFPFHFIVNGTKYRASNTAWGGPVVVDMDGEPREIKGEIALVYERAKELLEKAQLIDAGMAAVDKTGGIVDRRTNPDAVPIPCHQKRRTEQ